MQCCHWHELTQVTDGASPSISTILKVTESIYGYTFDERSMVAVHDEREGTGQRTA